jgi:predicted amidohydrolase
MAQSGGTNGTGTGVRPRPRSALGPVGPTVASYFQAFSPAPSWGDLGAWPPDVFALTNLVLDHTEAYRFAVAPPAGRRWPPTADWEAHVVGGAEAWRQAAGHREKDLPESVRRHWDRLVSQLDVPLAVIRSGQESAVWEDLLTLHAMADQACHRLAAADPDATQAPFERRAWRLLTRHGSLSRIDPARVRITPKTHFASRGITIRSLSRYLALNYESVDVHWRRLPAASGSEVGMREYTILLVPWPLEIRSSAFRPVRGPLENMDHSAFGFFSFEPEAPLHLERLARLVEAAQRHAPRIDAVVFPEASVPADLVNAIEKLLGGLGVVSVVAGVRDAPGATGLGRNYVHLGVCTSRGWQRFHQAKHHRWCLDPLQVRQYHLSGALDPHRSWWEAIDLPPRTVEIIDLGNGATSAPLVCEDLARMDEVADLLRRIGPTLVIALLLDGPQLPQRWPSRYATVLADEPGSAVLTLTSLGMALRSQPAGTRRSRVVAMWNDPTSGLRQIELARGASGILLRASAELKTVWTADGRRHERSTPSIALAEIHQLRIPADAAPGSTAIARGG